MPKEHITRVLLDENMEEIIHSYWQIKKQEDSDLKEILQEAQTTQNSEVTNEEETKNEGNNKV